MSYLFFISGEFEELGRIEIESFLRCFNGRALSFDTQIALGECDREIEQHFNRLAMVHEVSKHLFSCESVEELRKGFREVSLPSGKVCVRARNIGRKKADSSKLERELGSILWRRGARISVSKPDFIIRVYLSKRIHAGILLHKTDKKQFLLRRPDLKPFFRPGALLPRMARSLVNALCIKNGIVLDPMCGTGTFLVEAGLMNLDYLGIEAYREIAEGCKTNLMHYGLPRNVVVGDVKNMPIEDCSVDGITTDFPYLQSTRSLGRIEELYTRSFDEFERVLKPERRLIFLTNLDVDDCIQESFVIEYKLLQRLHKNLTRRIYICRR